MAYGSNVFTGGTASANAQETGHEASYAFDGTWDTTLNYWYANVGGGPPSWLKYDLGSGVTKTIRKIIFQNNSWAADYMPMDYTIQGSNNDSSWTTLTTVTGGSYATDSKVTLEFANSTAYRYYRMNITNTAATHAPPIILEMSGHEYVAENYTKTFNETITLSESFLRALTKGWAELLTLSEVFSKIQARFKTFTETEITISDNIVQQKGKSLSDIITITDLGIGRAFTRVYSEISNITDSIGKAITRSFADLVRIAFFVDSYSESNYSSSERIGLNYPWSKGQSFTGDGRVLSSVNFYLSKYGLPTGNAVVKIYAETHATNFGVDSLPVGSILATSDNFDVSTLKTSFNIASFTFSGVNKITLINGNYYVAVIYYVGGNLTNAVQVGLDSTSPTHNGNYENDGSSADAGKDICFYVCGEGDTLSKIKGYVRTLSDEFSITDLGITKAFARVFNELISLTEVFGKAITKRFNETAITITEAYSSTRAKIFNEIINITESFTKNFPKIFTETAITLSDTFTKLKGKNFFDTITIKEWLWYQYKRTVSLFSKLTAGSGIWTKQNPNSKTWTKDSPDSGVWTKENPHPKDWTR